MGVNKFSEMICGCDQTRRTVYDKTPRRKQWGVWMKRRILLDESELLLIGCSHGLLWLNTTDLNQTLGWDETSEMFLVKFIHGEHGEAASWDEPETGRRQKLIREALERQFSFQDTWSRSRAKPHLCVRWRGSAAALTPHDFLTDATC